MSVTSRKETIKVADTRRSESMQALRLRCERFMCENFHKILDDPLLHVRQNLHSNMSC